MQVTGLLILERRTDTNQADPNRAAGAPSTESSAAMPMARCSTWVLLLCWTLAHRLPGDRFVAIRDLNVLAYYELCVRVTGTCHSSKKNTVWNYGLMTLSMSQIDTETLAWLPVTDNLTGLN